MGPNQNPLVPNQNPLTPNQSPYATPSTPSNLGVRPAAQLSAAFLTQAFAWMFVGLLLTAGVAVVSSRAISDCSTSPASGPPVDHRPACAGVRDRGGHQPDQRHGRARPSSCAASVGLTIGLIVSYYTTASVATAFLSASAMFGGAAIYGAVTKRSLAGIGGILFIGLIGLIARR